MATNALRFTAEQELIRKNQDRTSEVQAAFIALIVLSTIAVIFRLISRRIAHVKLWWDDYLTIIALVGTSL